MPQTIPDLWPKSFGTATELTPTAILKMQASKLAEKTGGIVLGEVQSSGQGETLRTDFNLIAPALSNYRYRLFSIVHPLENYPVEISGAPGQDAPVGARDEPEFLNGLSDILNSERTRRIIQSLIEHSQ